MHILLRGDNVEEGALNEESLGFWFRFCQLISKGETSEDSECYSERLKNLAPIHFSSILESCETVALKM